MASILVHIESDGDRPRNISLQALGEGRRIASTLGATVYAHVVVDRSSATDETAWITDLSHAGADRVVFTCVDDAPGPARWDHHGHALQALTMQLEPALVLLAATHAGRELAPRLATSLKADFLHQPEVCLDQPGEVVLTCALSDHTRVRQVSVADLAFSTVVTLGPHPRHPALTAAGQAPATRVDMAEHGPVHVNVHYLDSADDPGGSLDHAATIVTLGAGAVSDAAHALVADLARALHGEIAATESRYAAGLAPAERVIGRGVRHVTPQLYVACAASGSRAHLDAVGRHAVIVAIDSDPEAPIFQVATYGIVGRLEDVIPRLLEGLAEPVPEPISESEPKVVHMAVPESEAGSALDPGEDTSS